MDIGNAIAKVRFSSARPQRVQLYKGMSLQTDVICLEPGQKLKVTSGEWVYYVVTGKAGVNCGAERFELPTGQFAAAADGETHTISNAGEQRLVVLAVGQTA